jgi:hypothetical protein
VNVLLGFLLFLAAAFLIVMLFAGDIWSRVWRVQRRRRVERLQRYNPRRVWRSMRKKPTFEVDLPTVRDFVLTIQLSRSLAETLAGALQQAARQFGERGVFGQRLQTRVRSQLQVEPERVILALANDFQSQPLFDMAERLDLAHEGGLSYGEAVNATLDEVEERIRIEVEKEIERAPVMLTIPMIIGVFFSALALLGFPLLVVMFNSVTASVSGASGGG